MPYQDLWDLLPAQVVPNLAIAAIKFLSEIDIAGSLGHRTVKHKGSAAKDMIRVGVGDSWWSQLIADACRLGIWHLGRGYLGRTVMSFCPLFVCSCIGSGCTWSRHVAGVRFLCKTDFCVEGEDGEARIRRRIDASRIGSLI